MKNKPTQLDKIKADLLAGMKVNSVYAFTRHGITRLSSIIHRLKRQGWPIITGKVNGNGLAVYTLPECWQPDPEQPPRQNDTHKKAG